MVCLIVPNCLTKLSQHSTGRSIWAATVVHGLKDHGHTNATTIVFELKSRSTYVTADVSRVCLAD